MKSLLSNQKKKPPEATDENFDELLELLLVVDPHVEVVQAVDSLALLHGDVGRRGLGAPHQLKVFAPRLLLQATWTGGESA